MRNKDLNLKTFALLNFHCLTHSALVGAPGNYKHAWTPGPTFENHKLKSFNHFLHIFMYWWRNWSRVVKRNNRKMNTSRPLVTQRLNTYKSWSMLPICSVSPDSWAQSTAMGRLRFPALALALVLLANSLPPTASAPQRQPQSQVEADAQPGLEDFYNFIWTRNFTDLSRNARDMIVLPNLTAEQISDGYW